MPASAQQAHGIPSRFPTPAAAGKCVLMCVVAAALCATTASPAWSQGKAGATSETTLVLQAEGDGYPIHITYYQAPDNKGSREDAPVLVMLHGEGGSRLIYDKSSAPPNGQPFAKLMNGKGYAVLTVDLRKHGESIIEGESRILTNDDFYKMAVGDLPAVKKFLVQEHESKRLNVNKLGIIASDSIVPVALSFAELDWRQEPFLDGPGGSFGTPRGQDVRAIVMLSPVVSLGRVNGSRAANFLKNPLNRIAFMVAAGTRDPEDRGASTRLFQVVSGPRQNEERVEFFRPNTNARGTDLLGNPAAKPEEPIHQFLDKNVRNLASPWKTRKSRYDRENPAQ